MLITLHKYLYGRQSHDRDQALQSEEICASLHHLSIHLLRSLESATFTGPGPEMTDWRERLSALIGKLEDPDGSSLLDGVGTPCRLLLEEHQAWLRTSEASRAAELQQMVSMLNQTVVALSAGSRRSIGRLRQIESDLVQSSQLQDLVALKSRLANCLAYVRRETEQEREDSARNLARMSEEVQRVRDAVVSASGSMPGRGEAEQATIAAYSRPGLTGLFAAIFTLDRSESIHSRFGPAAGDRIFRDFSQRILLHLADPKRVFRWGPFSILALLERDQPLDSVQMEMQQVGSEPVEIRLEVAGRTATLTLNSRWLVAPLSGYLSGPALIAEIDLFIGDRRQGLLP
jgi:hypothetical protein